MVRGMIIPSIFLFSDLFKLLLRYIFYFEIHLTIDCACVYFSLHHHQQHALSFFDERFSSSPFSKIQKQKNFLNERIGISSSRAYESSV